MIRLFRVFIPKSILALVIFDAMVILTCFVASMYVFYGPDTAFIELVYEDGLRNVALMAGSMLLTLYFQNLYSETRVQSYLLLLQQVILTVGIAFLVQAVGTYLDRSLAISRWVLLFGSGAMCAVFPLWRWAFTNVLYKGFGVDKILFLGSATTGMSIARRFLERPELGFLPAGVLVENASAAVDTAGVRVLGEVSGLRQAVAETRPDRIVVNMSERRNAVPVDTLLELRFSGIRIDDAATLFEVAFGRVSTQGLRPSQLIFSSELGPKTWQMRLQVAYCFLIAVTMLLVAWPVMLIVVLAVKLTSPGPVLFRQVRVGRNGVPFTLYKFRSMRADAEAQTGAVWAQRKDPRVTPVGGFLRRTRLDELPQLFNVLRGDMSIIGPRPERPEFVKVLSEQIPFYPQRHAVKPGLTGWAQINYKYGETSEDAVIKLEYDLYYIKNLSFSLDAYIMFHTAKVMFFSGHGQ